MKKKFLLFFVLFFAVFCNLTIMPCQDVKAAGTPCISYDGKDYYDGDTIQVYIDDSVCLYAMNFGSYGSKITWTLDASTVCSFKYASSSDSVSDKGSSVYINPKAVGKATITVSNSSGTTAVLYIDVVYPTISFTKTISEINMTKRTEGSMETDFKVISCSSSDENVLKVENGSYKTIDVTAVGLGTAQVIATDEYGQNVSWPVTVTADPLVITPTSLVIKEDETGEVEASGYVGFASDLVYSVADGRIASCTKYYTSCDVKGKKKGNTVVTVTDKIGRTASCTVTVKPKYTEAKAISITKSMKLIAGKKQKIEVSYDKTKYFLGKLIWSSSNKKIATVDSKGNVTAKKVGKATITCKLKNGKKYKCSVTVSCPVDSITKTLTITKGFKDKVEVDYKYGAKKCKIKWKSSNTRIATVDKNGNVSAKNLGACTITATSQYGKKYKCKVRVVENVMNGYSYDSVSPTDSSYGYVHLLINKAYYSGNDLVMVYTVWNNRAFTADSFDWIELSLKAKPKYNKVMIHKFTNVAIGLAPYTKKIMTFTIPNAPKVDLRNAIDYYDYYYWYSY